MSDQDNSTSGADTAGTDPGGAVQGEGNYEAARKFDSDEQKFINEHRGELDKLAKEARDALDGPEGAELEEAEEDTGADSDKDEI